MKRLKPSLAIDILIGVTVFYGINLPMVKVWWPESFTPLMWIGPAFFYIYEIVFCIITGRQRKMKPQSIIISSMIMRGVKFLCVAAMMLVWVKLGLAGKNVMLLYILIYYILTSIGEAVVANSINKATDEDVKEFFEPDKQDK